ncbi:MAG: hypothetical protein F6K11_24740 [Leptolyngbya sp. SIO3F4]|nr:hypothetical protein [Leptolyngbya sp. SIO3F4]
MGIPNEQQQDLNSANGKLALRDASLVAEELMLDVPAQITKGHSAPKSNSSYTVELFSDEALVTTTELLYGKTKYFLADIDSLQILKLHRKRSVIQKKLSNFLTIMLTSVGLILCFATISWPIRVLALIAAVSSIGYSIYFNWWIEQRGRGEFGLLMTMKLDTKVVITSHNLKAIQALYQIMFGRLDQGNIAGESMMVNMYTGEAISHQSIQD